VPRHNGTEDRIIVSFNIHVRRKNGSQGGTEGAPVAVAVAPVDVLTPENGAAVAQMIQEHVPSGEWEVQGPCTSAPEQGTTTQFCRLWPTAVLAAPPKVLGGLAMVGLVLRAYHESAQSNDLVNGWSHSAEHLLGTSQVAEVWQGLRAELGAGQPFTVDMAASKVFVLPAASSGFLKAITVDGDQTLFYGLAGKVQVVLIDPRRVLATAPMHMFSGERKHLLIPGGSLLTPSYVRFLLQCDKRDSDASSGAGTISEPSVVLAISLRSAASTTK